MSDFLKQLWQSNIELSLLLLVILIARYLIRKTTKNYNAYLLWLSIPVGIFVALAMSSISFEQPPVETVQYFVQAYIVRPSESFDSWLYLGYLWAFITVILTIRLMYQHRELRYSLKRISVPHKLEIKAKYSIIGINKKGFSPAVYGFIKPKIYFPVQLQDQLSAEQIELIIKHEEHHITQKHLWLNLLWDLLVCCLWFNPLVYIARQSFRHDQELFCDYLVLNQSSRQDQKSYGHALLTTISATHSVSLLCSWKMFNQLEERIMNIKKPTSLSSKISLAIGGLAIIGCTSLYAITISQYSKQDKDGDHRIEWNIDGKTYVDNNGDWFIYENGEKRALTKMERREFEKAVERAEKDMLKAEEEMRRAEEEMQKHEHHMELATREIEKAYHELEKNHQEIEQVYRDLETNYYDLEMDYIEGNISKEQLQTIKQELREAREQLIKNQKQYQKDIQRAKEQLKKSYPVSPPSLPTIQSVKPAAPAKPVQQSDIKFPKPVTPIKPDSSRKTATPLKTYPPQYPVFAAKNNIAGYVSFKFDVSEDGKPYNIKIMDSVPAKVFDEVALKAIEQWEFSSSDNGLKDVIYQLDFKLR